LRQLKHKPNQTTNTKPKRTVEKETDSIISHSSPPVFNGDNYETWAIRMQIHQKALDLWEAVKENYVVLDLPANQTITQLKIHKEKKTSPKLKLGYMLQCQKQY